MKLKQKIYEVIFEAETPAGKAFDLILILAILGSVAETMAETGMQAGRTTGRKYGQGGTGTLECTQSSPC